MRCEAQPAHENVGVAEAPRIVDAVLGAGREPETVWASALRGRQHRIDIRSAAGDRVPHRHHEHVVVVLDVVDVLASRPHENAANVGVGVAGIACRQWARRRLP